MTDFTQVIRWNANFVRGLAESVLNRAKTIRSGLTAESAPTAPAKKAAAKKKSSAAVKKRAPKKPRTRL